MTSLQHKPPVSWYETRCYRHKWFWHFFTQFAVAVHYPVEFLETDYDTHILLEVPLPLYFIHAWSDVPRVRTDKHLSPCRFSFRDGTLKPRS